jgi:hypothetical protein
VQHRFGVLLIRHADHAAQPFNQIFSARIDGLRRAGRPILREKALLRFSAVSFVQPGAADVGSPYAGFSGLQTKVDKTFPPFFMQSTHSFSVVFQKHLNFIRNSVYNIHLAYKFINRHS